MGGLVVVGGGASGIFAAIASARAGVSPVTVLEQGATPLRKLLASGGGRCNVMHKIKPPRELVRSYPRGERELLGPFSKRFSPEETWSWFEAEGVVLKTEPDGRVFPSTDDAETIATALRDAAAAAGVRTVLRAKVRRIATTSEPSGGTGRFTVNYQNKQDRTEESLSKCSAVLLATGSAPTGYGLAAELGHSLIEPYPSLFSFRIADLDSTPLAGLAGLALQTVAVSLELPPKDGREATGGGRRRGGGEDGLTQRGALLVTHRGLSGPVVLRLSAFGAAELRRLSYRGTLVVRSIEHPVERRRAKGGEAAAVQYCLKELRDYAEAHGSQQLLSSSGARPFPEQLPKRWWGAVCTHAFGNDEER